jgi:hypothetical protein
MPNTTYPNQRMVKVHRESVKTDFLGIKNENWKAASRNLRPPAFLLYLYLASNANNFTVALSPAAIRQEIGMARSTYHDQFHILVDKGYLVPTHGNTFDFYETPQPRPAQTVPTEENTDNGFDFTADELQIPPAANNEAGENIEININKIDSINNCGEEKQVSPTPTKAEFYF